MLRHAGATGNSSLDRYSSLSLHRPSSPPLSSDSSTREDAQSQLNSNISTAINVIKGKQTAAMNFLWS
jgi:hypothetical protein